MIYQFSICFVCEAHLPSSVTSCHQAGQLLAGGIVHQSTVQPLSPSPPPHLQDTNDHHECTILYNCTFHLATGYNTVSLTLIHTDGVNKINNDMDTAITNHSVCGVTTAAVMFYIQSANPADTMVALSPLFFSLIVSLVFSFSYSVNL